MLSKPNLAILDSPNFNVRQLNFYPPRINRFPMLHRLCGLLHRLCVELEQLIMGSLRIRLSQPNLELELGLSLAIKDGPIEFATI